MITIHCLRSNYNKKQTESIKQSLADYGNIIWVESVMYG